MWISQAKLEKLIDARISLAPDKTVGMLERFKGLEVWIAAIAKKINPLEDRLKVTEEWIEGTAETVSDFGVRVIKLEESNAALANNQDLLLESQRHKQAYAAEGETSVNGGRRTKQDLDEYIAEQSKRILPRLIQTEATAQFSELYARVENTGIVSDSLLNRVTAIEEAMNARENIQTNEFQANQETLNKTFNLAFNAESRVTKIEATIRALETSLNVTRAGISSAQVQALIESRDALTRDLNLLHRKADAAPDFAEFFPRLAKLEDFVLALAEKAPERKKARRKPTRKLKR